VALYQKSANGVGTEELLLKGVTPQTGHRMGDSFFTI